MTRRSLLVHPLLAGLLVASFGAAGVTAPRAEAAVGCSQAGANDFDGEGRDDVAVGDPLADAEGVQGAGSVHIVPVDGGKGLVITSPAPHAGDAFGWATQVTHFDNDRCLDVVVGAPYEDIDGKADAGAVYVFHGGLTPPKVTKIVPPRPERDAHFGWSLATARSTTHPGVIAVGAPYENDNSTTDAGAVYVYCADAQSGEPEAPSRITQESEGVVGNSEEGDMFGWSLVFGRLGGRADSVDLAIGTPYENDDGVGKQGGNSGKADTGAVEVVFDAAEQTKAYTTVKWGIPESIPDVTEHAGDRYGYALAYAEFGGKPYLAAGAPLADAGGAVDSGLVEIFQLGRDKKLAPVRTIRLGDKGMEGVQAKGKAVLGLSLAMVASEDDLCLAIGSPFDSSGATEAGVVREVLLTGDQDGRPLALKKPQAYDHFGLSLAAFGAGEAFAPGTGLLAGVPDARSATGGAVAVLQDGDVTRLLSPGQGGVPVVPRGSAADFGASVSG